MLLNNLIIERNVRQLWDKLWSGGISNPITAIEQISYLLFMRRIDEINDTNSNIFKGSYVDPETRESVDKSTLRWSVFREMPADELLTHIQTKVFPFMKTLGDSGSSFANYMQTATFVISKATLLKESMELIDAIYDEITVDALDGGQSFQDIQGDVYEMLLAEIASSGKNGQFRTPRHIIKLIAELVAPKIGEYICDPACGTGGFLLGSFQYIITSMETNKKNLVADDDGFIHSVNPTQLSVKDMGILDRTLLGYDIDVTMVRFALMNLMMHGMKDPKIECRDTLSKSFEASDKYDVILANPPFTGSVDKGDLNDVLTALSTTKTELLFLENIYEMLRPGGRAGVVIPQGVLFGGSKAAITVRKRLIEDCSLDAVISMPSGVFKPYAGVSTAILLFSKGTPSTNVWFYNMLSDGYALDDKRTKEEGFGDLQDIIKQFRNRSTTKYSDRKRQHFFVSKQEIEDNNYDLSFNLYADITVDDMHYEEPKAVVERIKLMENTIIRELSDIEEILP